MPRLATNPSGSAAVVDVQCWAWLGTATHAPSATSPLAVQLGRRCDLGGRALKRRQDQLDTVLLPSEISDKDAANVNSWIARRTSYPAMSPCRSRPASPTRMHRRPRAVATSRSQRAGSPAAGCTRPFPLSVSVCLAARMHTGLIGNPLDRPPADACHGWPVSRHGSPPGVWFWGVVDV